MRNLATYICLGCKNSWMCCCCGPRPHNLVKLGVQVLLDGEAIELPCCAEGVTAINVPSYANGTSPWRPGSAGCCTSEARAARLGRQITDDGLIEARNVGGHSWVAYGWNERP